MPTRPVLVAGGLSFSVALAASAAAARAQYDVRGFVSSRGLDFIAEQAPSLVPASLDAPDLSKELACITATQRDTRVDVHVDDLSLTIPQPGRLRLFIQLDAEGDGELFVDNAVACFGSLTCQDHIAVRDARATIEFDLSLTDGRPSIVFRSVDLQLSPDDIDLAFSGCAVGDIATAVIGFAKQFVFDFLLDKAEELAVAKLGPLVESALASVGTSFSGGFSGPFGTFQVGASLDDLVAGDGGIGLGASVSLSGPAEAAECVAEFDTGAPAAHGGDAPDLAAVDAHLGLALDLGLAEDAVYQVWRQGLTCISGDTLEALGIELPIEKITALMPGFPPGTELTIQARLTRPPVMAGAGSGEDGASMTMGVDGVEVVLHGALPDGSQREVHVTVDVEATAAAGIDRDSNALVATPQQVTLKRLEMDQVSVSQTGFDVARLGEVLRDHIIPELLGELGQLPLTGPVFQAGPLPFAVILRGMDTTAGFLSVYADLFRIPEGDIGAPETSILEYPSGAVSPADAVVRVSGVDGLIPTDLLQYQVSIDGQAGAPSYIRRFTVGQAGASGTYQVQVAAVDLAGNTDPTPASVTVEVDGVGPEVLLAGDRVRDVEEAGPIELGWTMSDDRTAAADLAPRIELYVVTDPEDVLSVEHLRTIDLARGATAGTVEVEKGSLYRAELHVADAVGNETVSAVLLDASDGDGGGCAAAPGSRDAGLGSLLLALAAIGLRRRSLSAARSRSRG